MSDFLTYFPEGQEYVGYRSYFLFGIATSAIESLHEKTISTEQGQRSVREENERTNMADLLTQQTREREERATRMAEDRNAVIERLEREQRAEKKQQLRKIEAKTAMFNSALYNQGKTSKYEREDRESKLREENRRLKELEEQLERQKARQRKLEREKRQEGFNSREQELLKSIRQTELSISKLHSKIEADMDLIDEKNRDTIRLLEVLEKNQQSILQREEDNLEWKQRYGLSEHLRKETEKAYLCETKERQREESEMQLAKLESALKIADSDLIRKWQSKEFDKLKKEIANIRKDFEKGNHRTVVLSADELLRKLEVVGQKAYADEKLENQRVYISSSFLKALRYLGYNKAHMFQQNPKDSRSLVVIRGESPSGNRIELKMPSGEVYSIKLSGMKEEKCCSEEDAIRKVMDKFGIGWRPLEPLRSSGTPNGNFGTKLQFRDGNKKITLTHQLCG